jgi:hypothetical protein
MQPPDWRPARERNADQQTAGNGRGIEEAAHRLDRDGGYHRKHRNRIDEGRQHFGAPVAVRCALRRRTARDGIGEQRKAERSRIGDHVPRIRQQRERPRHPAADGLDHRESKRDRQRNPQRAPRTGAIFGRDPMTVGGAGRMRATVLV